MSNQGVLACVLCQQRKVKCDRQFPCANCLKVSAQCVSASRTPRQKRSKNSERELVERLRRYEGLLRLNNITFESTSTSAGDKAAAPGEDGDRLGSPIKGGSNADRASRETTIVKSETSYEAKNIWSAMNQRSQDSEDDDNSTDIDDNGSPQNGVRPAVITKAWDQSFQSSDHLLFGSGKSNVSLTAMHPEQAHIFRLWQIYLENVNPLLKVTHVPTLQGRIVGAVSDISKISPPLEALMFSIYCVSLFGLLDDECIALLGSPKEELLTTYQLACQQALLNCGFLKTGDRECLIAFYLYLVSIKHTTDPRSLSAMLGVAIRIAQRMGIHNESSNSRCTIFEAEMRRRLWWSLVVFDNRICELADYKTAMLAPTWDCRVPLNVNDSDIWPTMKTLPSVSEKPTEALFAVVRCEVGNVVRHSAFWLDFTNPSLKPIANSQQESDSGVSEAQNLESFIENKYFNFCNPDNPLHFLTIWMTRGNLARNHLLEHYSRYSKSIVQQTDTQRNTAISYALSMLECDTKLMTSPLIKGYLWQVYLYFPFPAYIHLVQDLRKRPVGKQTELIWETMSNNYESRFMHIKQKKGNVFIKIFSRIILQAWGVREEAFRQHGMSVEPPPIIADIQRKVQTTPKVTVQQSHHAAIRYDDFPMSIPTNLDGRGLEFPDLPGLTEMGSDMDQFDWTGMDWNTMQA